MTDEAQGGKDEENGQARVIEAAVREEDKLTKKEWYAVPFLGVRLRVIYKSCENPFQTLSNTNHHSVDGCQQHRELPFLFQTCSMFREQHFKREITLHFTIHYASSLPDCPHKSPNIGLKRTAISSELKLWKQHSCMACSVCSCVSSCYLERHSAGSVAVTRSFYRLIV